MPYFRCPSCGLLAHVNGDHTAAIHCARCRALQKDVRLLPLEQSLKQIDRPPERPYKPAAEPPS
jgi:phage FluMu protein Com